MEVEDNETLFIKFSTKEKINAIEIYKDNFKLMIKSFYDESNTYIFLDNFKRLNKFSNNFFDEFLKDLNDNHEQKKLLKELKSAASQINSDNNYNTYFKKYAAFIISISPDQMILLRKNKNNEVMERLFKDLQYSLIIVSDMIFLKNIFKRQYNFDINKAEINILYFPPRERTRAKVHPDTTLGYQLNCFNNIKNKYIGVSHLSCILCTLFLDSYGFSFRGTSKKFEFWKFPSNYTKDPNKHAAFVQKFENISTSIEKKEQIQFLKDEPISICQNWYGIMAIEICDYKKILHSFASQMNINIIEHLYNTQNCCKDEEVLEL